MPPASIDAGMAEPDLISNVAPRLLPRAAFVVQLGTAIDLAAGTAAGRVEHVSSGRAAHFHTTTELLAFIQLNLEREGVSVLQPDSKGE